MSNKHVKPGHLINLKPMMKIKIFQNSNDGSYWMQVGEALIWVPQKVAFHVAEVNGISIVAAGGKKEMQIICNEK